MITKIFTSPFLYFSLSALCIEVLLIQYARWPGFLIIHAFVFFVLGLMMVENQDRQRSRTTIKTINTGSFIDNPIPPSPTVMNTPYYCSTSYKSPLCDDPTSWPTESIDLEPRAGNPADPDRPSS